MSDITRCIELHIREDEVFNHMYIFRFNSSLQGARAGQRKQHWSPCLYPTSVGHKSNLLLERLPEVDLDILKSSGEGDKTCVEGQQIVTYRINHIKKTCWVTFTGACYAMYRKSILLIWMEWSRFKLSCVSDIQRLDSHPLKVSSFNVTGYTLWCKT